MLREVFTSRVTGELAAISSPNSDWAFVPNTLPPNWKVPEGLWPAIVEARSALAELNATAQNIANFELLAKPVQVREAISSSSLEGTYVTPEDLLRHEATPFLPGMSETKRADWLEVHNYQVALTHGQKMLDSLPLVLRVIREMHTKLMHGARGSAKQPGKFRNMQVVIGTSARFVPPPASYVDGLMNDFEHFVNEGHMQYDPLVASFLAHYQFEAIHPFLDGNGRIGRTVLALMIYKLLGHLQPWLYMSSYFADRKDDYIEKLFRVSTEGDWTGWVEFCLEGVVVQARDSISRCQKLLELREKMKARLKKPTVRSLAVIEQLFAVPYIAIPEHAKLHSITYNTSKRDIERLVECGVLTVVKGFHPKLYWSLEVMDIAYTDM